jgi:UDPglucose--hexose-1-phosphate uridylyltransferase
VPELRSDKLTDTWVIVAEERRSRPIDFRWRTERKPEAGAANCPFCAGHEGMTPPETLAFREPGSAPDGPGWRVRCVPNKFPSLGPLGSPAPMGHVLRSMAGVGAHEVVVEGPEHARPFRDRAAQEWEELALALQARVRALAQDPRVAYVLAFKNAGPASGATLEHPHSQVLALPLVPERVRRETHALEEHHRLTERCLLEDVLAEEEREAKRVIERAEGFVCVAPFASRLPYEMLLAPEAHEPRFEDAAPDRVKAFGRALGRAFVRLERVLAGSPFESYHFALHTAPARERAERYHWHCEVLPSSAFHSGFEKGTGMFVNHLSPEAAAERLRSLGS